MIRLRPIVYLLSFIAVIEAAFMAIPWIVGIALGDDTVLAFGVTIAALLAIGIPFIVKKPVDPHLSPKGGFLIAALSWVVLSVFGALPFVISGYIPDFIDALFEIVSGFTTTGASIVSNVEALPKSLLLWRSLTHWIGGMGILVFIIAILPRFDNRIIHVFRAESPGPQVGKLVSKLRFTARILYGIYIVMTVIEIALLSVEMSFFDAVIHSFGTAGTGGFSSRNASVAAFDSAYVDGVITVFMFLFGINFNIFYFVLIGNFSSVFRNEELRTYFFVVLFAIFSVATVNTLDNVYETFGESMRYSSFQVVSVMSTTGFITADYTLWPTYSQAVLFILMFLGGCAGSTAGGLKISRIVILFKTSIQGIKKSVSPRLVLPLKIDGKRLDPAVASGVTSYFSIYMLILGLSFFLVALSNSHLGHNDTLLTSLSSVVTCINNVGPGWDAVGPVSNFSGLSGFSKLVLSFDMLAGRLELLPLLILFYPKSWKNS